MFVIVALQTKCGGFASLRMNCNRKSRSLRDDNQRGKCKSNGNGNGKSAVKANLGVFVASTAGEAAAGVAIDGALFIAGGTVVFLLSDGGKIGGVILGGHGDGA
jgi:hypothetical protein